MSEVWYHGTRRGFSRGGYLFPRVFHKGAGTSAGTNPGRASTSDADLWVYLTLSLDLAWAYAYCASGRGRPKVLVVTPFGSVEPDPEHSAAMQAYRCHSARVTAVLTESTMTEDEARQGWQYDPV